MLQPHTQGEIQGPLEPVGTLPLEVNSFRKPTKQKTPNLNGSVGMFSTGPGWKMLYCAMEIYNEERGWEGRGLLLPAQPLMGRFSPAFLRDEGRGQAQGPGRVSHRNSVPQSETFRNPLK